METIARYIDHTLLKPEAKPEDIVRLCEEAKRFGFATVCVNSGYVELAAQQLRGSDVGVCSVVGFPLGACLTGVKVAEAKAVVKAGASELDMVMNIGLFKGGQFSRVRDDIRAVVAEADGRVVKVIIEAGLLTEDEKRRATELVIEAGAHFVKTSTGFLGGGATKEDVALLAQVARGRIGVKASGGIRTFQQAKELIAAGATRLGTSAGIAIVQEEKNQT
ncbi:deoxyribose-phosphate aldolase [candidate division WOR-3 bacterium]|nr:deoxyribose-phosphate aldolase [candidate division WOR-3 bacterium]